MSETVSTREPATTIVVPLLLDAEALRQRLRANLTKGSWRNWLARVTKSQGFPKPLCLGSRGSLAWDENEVLAWLQERRRGGRFDGRRRGQKG